MKQEEYLSLLVDLHKNSARQGPGGEEQTKKAIDIAIPDKSIPLQIADIGCGTGASTLQLARELNGHITAIDFTQQFLDILNKKAKENNLSERITTLNCSMATLPCSENQFDLIWSEGAVYNIGFENGITYWRRFLKPDGIIAVSEITWLTETRPYKLDSFWQNEYPEIDTAPAKISILEKHGYHLLDYYYLPKYCWRDNYYLPIQNEFVNFLSRHNHSQSAQELIEAEKEEIALFEKYNAYYSYSFYVAVRDNNK